MTGTGKCQILSFHIPGEIPDIQSLYINAMDHSLATVTPCKIGFITHEALKDLYHRQPHLGDAPWRETLIDAAIFRERIIELV